MDKYYHDFTLGIFNHFELRVDDYQRVVLPYLMNKIKEKDAIIKKLNEQNHKYKNAIFTIQSESEDK